MAQSGSATTAVEEAAAGIYTSVEAALSVNQRWVPVVVEWLVKRRVTFIATYSVPVTAILLSRLFKGPSRCLPLLNLVPPPELSLAKVSAVVPLQRLTALVPVWPVKSA